MELILAEKCAQEKRKQLAGKNQEKNGIYSKDKLGLEWIYVRLKNDILGCCTKKREKSE